MSITAAPGYQVNAEGNGVVRTAPVEAGYPNGNPNPTPILNATFPQTPAKTVAPPTVVTSDAANDHVAQMTNSSKQMSSDLSQVQPPQPTQPITSQTPSQTSTNHTDTSQPSSADDITSQIQSLLNGGTDEISSNTINSEEGTVSEDQQALSDLTDQQNSLYDTMSALSSGSVPLTPIEQAQVNDVGASYAGAITDAQKYAASIAGGADVANANSGLSEYSPAMAAANLKSAIISGGQRIGKINSDMISAQAKLSQSLTDGDYKAASDAYTQVGNLIKDRQSEIQNINTAIDREQTQIRDAQTTKLTALMDENTISYQQKQQALAESTLDEKTKNDLSERAIQQQTLALKQQAQNGTNVLGNTVSVPITTTGPDPVAQQNFLTTLPGGATGGVATLIKGLADYSINPSSFTVRNYNGASGLTQSEAVMLAKQYDPSYDEANYAAAAKYLANLKSTANNTTGGQLASANKAIEHLTTFAKAVGALDNGNALSIINAGGNALRQVGSPKFQSQFTQAKSEASIISNELPKYFRGSGMAESDIKTWADTIDPNSTPGQLKGTLAGTLSLLSEQLGVSYADYQNALGHAPPAPGQPGSLLTGAAWKALNDTYTSLQNEGIDVSGIDLSQFAGQLDPDPINIGTPPGANPANNPIGI